MEIYEKINKDIRNKPYNIYITDENLIIKNTTFSPDLNFDLSFAKEVFEKHKQENIIGVSLPIYETYSSKFFSYSDSYLDEKRVLQVSFTYEELEPDLKKLQKLLDSTLDIKSSTAFIIYEDGYIGDFIFKISNSKKPSLQEIEDRIKKGKKLSKDINENEYITDNFIDIDKGKISYY